jgi:uncharacterized membrane protein YfhO
MKIRKRTKSWSFVLGVISVAVLTADAAAQARPMKKGTPPAIRINDITVTEGNSGTVNAIMTVALSAPYSERVTVDYETADDSATVQGNDYLAKRGALTFMPGEAKRTLSVAVKADNVEESSERFYIRLLNPGNATLADDLGIVTIIDDDRSTLSIGDATVIEGHSGTVNMLVMVTLSVPSSKTVTVEFATADRTATVAGNDYAAARGTLIFRPGETTKTLTVAVKGDTESEPNETFYVRLMNGTNATLDRSNGIATITNDD